MKAVRVTEEWQRAGVHYVRTQAMCLGFKIPLEGEFSDDTPEDEYILVMDGIYPVSTCRLHYLDEHTGKIDARKRCDKNLYQFQKSGTWIL